MSDDAARLVAAGAALGHAFADSSHLQRALTHASWCGAQASNRDRLRDANERIEFLGDALLGAALCLLLVRRLPDASEGDLSRKKAQLASRATLARLMDRLAIAEHCRIGAQMQIPWPDSVKANLMESALAAIFLDAGWDACVAAVERWYGDQLVDDDGGDDPKTALQEWALEEIGSLPTYASQRSGGSDHEPEFSATVTIADRVAHGHGRSRRKAEAAAAAAMLTQLNPPPDPPISTSPG